jgi:hypothetical protein
MRSKPHFVQFDALDKDCRRGTGALPVAFAILAGICFALGILFGMTVSSIFAGIVSGCFFLAISAVVKSIRSIEAYTIYMARVQRWMMHNACPSDCSPDAAPDKPVDSKPEIDSIQPSKPSDPSKFIN